MSKTDIQAFARRVEIVCDYFIDRLSKEDGVQDTNDLKVITDLKEEAADIQFSRTGVSEAITGLYDYVHGVPQEESK